MKTAPVLGLAIVLQAAGNTCLSHAMRQIGARADAGLLTGVLLPALDTPLVWLGTLLLVLFFALFLAALSWEDLSVVLPVTAVGYALNVAFAHWFLHEGVSAARWTGTALVVLGVALVSRTTRPPARPRAPGAGTAAAPGLAGAPPAVKPLLVP